MSSIFIAIPTLRDPQYKFTIEDIFNNSSGEHEIFVGTAITTDDEKFVKSTYKMLKKYPNVKTIRLDAKTQYGVGNGRYHSMKLYSGQDYVMQLDSHTKLERDWDKFVINLYQEALDHTQNPKTIVTTYLGRYEYDGNTRTILDDFPRYATFVPNQRFGGIIPVWEILPPSDLEDKDNQLRWLPANTYAAQFAISDSRLASAYDDNVEAHFLDEEIINAINLIDQGYSLIYPNMPFPLTHLYADLKGGSRHYSSDKKDKNLRDHMGMLSGIPQEVTGQDIASKRFAKFMKANPEKTGRYEQYVGFKMISGPKKILGVPKDFSR